MLCMPVPGRCIGRGTVEFFWRFRHGRSVRFLSQTAWKTFSEGYGPVRALVGKLDPERRAQFEADFVAFHQRFTDELGITVPREYWIVHGTRR